MQLSMFYTLITSKRDQCLSSPAKIRVYQTLVLPVLLCACGAWTVLAAGAKRLEAFHMKCQRQIMMIRWREHVRNTGVASLTGLCPVLDLSTRCRNVVFGHIAIALRRHASSPSTPVSRQLIFRAPSWSRLETSSGPPKQPMDRPDPQGQQQHTTSWFVEAIHRASLRGHSGWRYGPCRLRVNDDDDDGNNNRNIR